MASSIFCPAKLPPKNQLESYGCNEIELLSNSYGRAASVEYEGATYTSPPLINAEDLVSEWKVYRRAMLQEKERLIASKGNVEIPSMQDVAATMMSFTSYADIFPETFKVIQILLTLPVGTATVELMSIAIEGPELQAVHFNYILNMYKETNRRILL